MLKNLLKLVGLARKTMQDTIDNSTDFVEDTLEKEYITGTIQKAKDITGEVAVQAGKLYGKAKAEISDAMDSDTMEPIKSKVEDITADLKTKGELLAMKAMSNEKVRNVVNDINEAKDKFMSEIVDFTDEDDEVKEAEENEAKKKKILQLSLRNQSQKRKTIKLRELY